MKQESSQKRRKWIWLVAGLAMLLVILGVVLALILPGQNQGEGTSEEGVKLYWNIDKTFYTENSVTGLSTREPGDDGLFYVRFAVDGEQVELAVVGDKQLINYMDTMDVVGLTTDADGVVVDVLDPKTIATEVAKDVFVQQADGSAVTLNSSKAMNGMEIEISLNENTGVYDVNPNAELIGQVSECAPLDKVTVYADETGAVTHVFISERAVEAGVYWRVERKYDTTTAQSTRKPDENGIYTILFAHNGEQVELKCRDAALVNEIDAGGQFFGEFALVFDEEGYIVDTVDVATALVGAKACSNYNITELNGNTFTATRMLEGTDVGKTVTATYDDSCDIFLVEDGCTAAFIGERVTQLQMNDRITCYTDLEGNPILIFVVRRTIDSPMYYNLERKYSKGDTTRTPDASGYYVFEMVVDGDVVTLRTKDKAVAAEIDSYTSQAMGLKVNGDIIETVYHPNCVCGWSGAGERRYVTALSGPVCTLTYPTDFENASNRVIREDCKIYDVTGYPGVKLGSETTLRMNDRVTAFMNISGELTHIFVIGRYMEDASVYYNITRRYNSTTQETTRVPDEEGYYVYDMICEGKQVQVKTKSKTLASYIDQQNAPLVALEVSGGIVKNAYPAEAAIQYCTGKTANFHYVGAINGDGTFNTYYIENGVRKESQKTHKLAENCVIYNVSTGYQSYRGEKTTLKLGDRIQAFTTNPNDEITQIFILQRKIDAPLYWKVDQKYSTSKQETTREPDAEGYYVFDLAVNGTIKQFKTKDKDIASAVDKFNLAFTLRTDGNIITQAYTADVAKGVKGNTVGGYDVMSIDGSKVTVTRNRPLADNTGDTMEVTFASDCKIYDVSSYAQKFGAEATLQVGDRVQCYANDEGEVIYCYIVNKNTRAAGAVSYCMHCGENVFWEPYTGALYQTNVHYYLTHDMQRTSQLVIGSEKAEEQPDIVFDLNGHTLSAEKRGFLVYGTLSIMDSAGGGKVATKNVEGSFGGCVMVTGGGTLNIYSGTLTRAEGGSIGGRGGVLYVSGAETTLNMYGGTVTGGAVAAEEGTPLGGNIYLNGSTFNLYGGTVSNGSAGDTGYAGNIYVLNATFNMSGGIVSGGTAKYGGGVLVESTSSSSVFNMKGGTVTGGTAANQGGNVYLTSEKENLPSVLNMTGGGITGGTATNGGNLYVRGYSNAVVGGTVEKGSAATQGSNIYFYTKGGNTLLITGKVTEPGAVTSHGGNILASGGGEVILDGGTVSGGTTEANGGNIYLTGGMALTVQGETVISGGKAAEGGNIATNSSSTVITLNECTVTGGSAMSGGNISLLGAAKLNIKGASITDGIAASGTGANIAVTGKAAAVTVESGTVTGGDISMTGAGDEQKATLTVAGGTLEAVTAGTNTALTLSGAPKLSSLTLESGVKITLGELTEDASITVSASGVFTEANDKAADYAKYFIPAVEGDAISVENNALCYMEAGSYHPYNDSISEKLDENGYAVCPACGGDPVLWTALGSTDRISAAGHYYLQPDTTYGNGNPNFVQISNGTVCLHLDGNDLSVKGRFLVNSAGVLNIMGHGNVSSYQGATSNTYGTLWCNAGTINLYGGTYTCDIADKPVLTVASVSGVVNIYAGASLADTDNKNLAMTAAGTLNMDSGSIAGGAEAAAGAKITLTGAPKITGTGLTLPQGTKLTLGKLTKNASVAISATGVFTEPNDSIETYAAYFTCADRTSQIKVVDKTLVSEKIAGDHPYNAPISQQLDENGYAVCPACGGDPVLWTQVGNTALTPGGHYYLATDMEPTTPNANFVSFSSAATVCLHLNGNDLRVMGRFLVGSGGTLNIMGHGNVSSYQGDSNNTYGTLWCNTGTINLYGGTYTCEIADKPVLTIGNAKAVVNMYAGASLADTDNQNLAMTAAGSLNIYGGSIAGNAEAIAGAKITLSGAPSITGTGLTLPQGTKLTLGELTENASVVISATGIFTEPNDNAAVYANYFIPAENGYVITAKEDKSLYCEESDENS